MRTSIRIILAVWMTLFTTSTFAQKGQASVEQAFNKAVNTLQKGNYVTDTKIETYKDGAYYKNYCFAIPENKKKIIDAVNKALGTNDQYAYNIMNQNANSNGKQQIDIAYGDNNEKKRQYGNSKETNYRISLFKDEQNNKKRYAYILTWMNTKDGMLKGMLHRIYGTDPKAQREEESNRWGSHRWDSNITIPSQDEMKKQWEEIEKNKKKWEEKLKQYYQTTPKNSTEFLMMFNNYRQTFKNIDDFVVANDSEHPEWNKAAIQIVVANRLMQLCNNNASLLNTEEKKFCANTLLKMKKETDDEDIKGILDLTGRNLLKK